MAAEGWSGGHGGSGRGRGKRRTKDGSSSGGGGGGGGGGNEGVGGSVHTLGIEVRDGTGLRGGREAGERTRESKRRAEGGGSFISLPHGIIYREDFRESTQRAPR